ncbi:exonuclease SbcCD subunit D [Streptomyces lusitanus]|uniref:metallophosphoesterase family protein n=1 Tax=Streptomyces lusitanus TaxID=68232 RepID=UPI003634C2A0
MRLLHTSDWHLAGAPSTGEPARRPARLPGPPGGRVREVRVQAVLVAGDVYDRALPGLEAVALFDRALHRLAGLGVPTVFISGNHDSARRLGVGAGLIDRAGIHLRTDPAGCATPVLLADEHGPVAVYGLPYLEPALVRESFGLERGGHAAVLGAATERVRADLAGRPAGHPRGGAGARLRDRRGAQRQRTRHRRRRGRERAGRGLRRRALRRPGPPARLPDPGPARALQRLPARLLLLEVDHRKSMWLVDLAATVR